MYCCFAEAKFSAWNLFELAPYGKFGFSRPDLDGNKLAKGICLARKERDKEVYCLIVPRVVKYSVFFILCKSASKGLMCDSLKILNYQ